MSRYKQIMCVSFAVWGLCALLRHAPACGTASAHPPVFKPEAPLALQKAIDYQVRRIETQQPVSKAEHDELEKGIGAIDPDHPFQFEVPEVVRRLGERAIPMLARLLADPDPATRLRACHALSLLSRMRPNHTPEYVEFEKKVLVPLHLRSRLDSDARVRVMAIASLGARGRQQKRNTPRSGFRTEVDPRIIPALEEALSDPSENVRRAAVQSLYSLGRREKLPPEFLKEMETFRAD